MRDYKSRVIDRRRAREVPVWFWFVAAMAVGTLVALIVYLASLPRDGQLPAVAEKTVDTLPPSLSAETSADDAKTMNEKAAVVAPDTDAKKTATSKKVATSAPPTTQAKYQFYDVLPGIKVDVPPNPEPVAPTTKPTPRDEPKSTAVAPIKNSAVTKVEPTPSGRPTTPEPQPLPISGDRYMLLAGYFTSAREAEQLRNRIAGLGFSASVQAVKSGNKEPRYRVRLGPYDHKQADDVRNKLRAGGIYAVPLKANG